MAIGLQDTYVDDPPTLPAVDVTTGEALPSVDMLRTVIAQQRENVEQLQDALRVEREAMVTFRQKVARVGAEVRRSQGWCWEGYSEVMEQLGCTPVTPSYSASMTVSVTVSGIEADDGYDAQSAGADQVRRALRDFAYCEVIDSSAEEEEDTDS